MQPEVCTTPISYTITGRSLRHDPTKPFGPEVISLLNQVWPILKANSIQNDGINRVVYDTGCHGPFSNRADNMTGCQVFAGVILTQDHPDAATLETKHIHLTRYAYWKHTGPYHLIPRTGQAMIKALESQGHKTNSPMIEVYGHWTNDETKLETETVVALLPPP